MKLKISLKYSVLSFDGSLDKLSANGKGLYAVRGFGNQIVIL